MNQRGGRLWLLKVFALIALGAGCNRKAAAPAPAVKSPTVASLVPAATDLLMGMGCGDHLVAVSDFDLDARTANLPRVGDYQHADWEKLSTLRPNLIVTQFDSGRIPAGFIEQCGRIGATQLNLHIERLSDIDVAMISLGTACEEPAKAAAEVKRLRQSIEAVRHALAGRPRIRTLIVIGATGLDLAGRDTFLDDLLNTAGGENATTAARYVTIDREALAALRPDAVLQLLPGADARTLEQAAAFWDTLPELPAVKEHRVWQLTPSFIMQPGSHVAESAAIFAQKLHPEAQLPSTTQASP